MAKKQIDPSERKFVDVNADKKDAVTVGKPAEKSAPAPAGHNNKDTGLRIVAFVMWALAIACEVLAILLLSGELYIPGDSTVYLIIGIVADLIFVVIGSLLWKKANRIDPASKSEKVRFFIQSQLGVIMSIVAFLPLVIVLLKDKDLAPKTKKIVSVIAVVALLAAAALSIDFNPPSQEDLQAAQQQAQAVNDGTVYWTRFGHSYHLDPNCQTLLHSEYVYSGSVEQAFEANRTDPCNYCAGGN